MRPCAAACRASGFRVLALREAVHLGLDGFVLNEQDGSVRVVAEGPRADLEALVDRLEDGPPGALVERVVARWEPARGLAGRVPDREPGPPRRLTARCTRWCAHDTIRD